jgi:hypothetical protein
VDKKDKKNDIGQNMMIINTSYRTKRLLLKVWSIPIFLGIGVLFVYLLLHSGLLAALGAAAIGTGVYFVFKAIVLEEFSVTSNQFLAGCAILFLSLIIDMVYVNIRAEITWDYSRLYHEFHLANSGKKIINEVTVAISACDSNNGKIMMGVDDPSMMNIIASTDSLHKPDISVLYPNDSMQIIIHDFRPNIELTFHLNLAYQSTCSRKFTPSIRMKGAVIHGNPHGLAFLNFLRRFFSVFGLFT